MPKKFVGENSKSAAARVRKEAIKKEEQERKKQAEEDAYWQDDDKAVMKKQQRKEEAERKRMEAAQRKQENRQAYDKEMDAIGGYTPSRSAFTKMTQATITNRRLIQQQKEEKEQERILRERRIQVVDENLEENVNQLVIDGEVARSVTDAINILSIDKPDFDRHPEKRMKAAYQDFEEKMLPRLKEEHPTFRLSQLRQLLKKDWQKSPENPLNQRQKTIV
ncbi:unnamed protein product [Dracunculus medinensis]|uniref:Coiled-coil domain-containing protein 124 n=1 Tax=Dracunculus medinensis TaxID=318479 RepID=A0A0N4U5T5_DRAME|nr:unnamed protein product [Dracunculus medinensis]